MVSPEARAEIERMFARKRENARRFPDGKPVAVGRSEWEAEAQLLALPGGARFEAVDIAGVPAEWMDAAEVVPGRVLLLLHGGGYNAGSPRTHRKLAALLGAATRMRVLTPDYRLAPEHPFPAGLDDARRVLGWVLGQGVTSDNIVIAGDSAGGGLTLSLLLALRDAGAPMPRAAVLMSPWTDLTASSPSYGRFRDVDPSITQEGLQRSGRWYAGDRDPADPLVSPLFADPSGLPPLLIHVGGDEVMLDDARLFAEKASHAGVAASYREFEGMWHVHHHGAPAIPESVEALEDIAAFIRAQFGD